MTAPNARASALLPWLPALGWMGVIFIASTLPGSTLPGGYSTYGHLAEYAVLGVLLYLPARRRLRPAPAALVALAIASVYGVTDELHQFLTPGRTPDTADWATDTLGAVAGIAVAVVVLYTSARRKADREAGEHEEGRAQ